MPRGDGTGPMGMGSMTGRGAGFCAGFNRPGFANRGYGLGLGMGRRNGAFGVGMREPRQWRGDPSTFDGDDKKALRRQLEVLQGQMDAIKKRLDETE